MIGSERSTRPPKHRAARLGNDVAGRPTAAPPRRTNATAVRERQAEEEALAAAKAKAEGEEVTEDELFQESAEVEIQPEVVGYQRFGRYDTAFELASGGFATVYLARARGPGGFEKIVAVKRIHEHLANQDDFVEMFLDEARIAASISHPNICSVFDFGFENGMYFLAMDYILGEPLSKVMPRLRRNAQMELGASRYALAARIVADAADGLHAAHEALGQDGEPMGIVHRDVAPVNLFVRYDGHVQVVDFGIAKARGKLHSTAAGVMKGHMAYMSPEQFKGAEVDRRTDVWALGVILWEICYNSRLYKRDSDVNTMLAVLSEPIEQRLPPAKGVPKPLVEIICKALAKDREDRYDTARDMSKALHNYLQGAATPVGAPEAAEMVARLFPGGRREKLGLIDRARKALEISANMTDTLAEDPPTAISDRPPSMAPPPARSRAATSLEEVHRPAPPKSQAWKYVALGAAMLACMVVGATGVLFATGAFDKAAPAAELGVSTKASPEMVIRGQQQISTGRLVLTLEPGERDPGIVVRLGDRMLGTLPLATTLDAGDHVLLLETPRGKQKLVSVSVAAGQLTQRSVSLKQKK